MADKNTSTGIGFLGLLTIAFIVLKLCHVIEWSWLWVLAPMWIPLAVVIALCVLYVILGFIEKKR